MKTAIYIEDGLVQLVVTPETEFEKNALQTFNDKPLTAQIFSGSFYDCRGGWVRQSAYQPGAVFRGHREASDCSLMLCARKGVDDKA
jgi:hypothetical protein